MREHSCDRTLPEKKGFDLPPSYGSFDGKICGDHGICFPFAPAISREDMENGEALNDGIFPNGCHEHFEAAQTGLDGRWTAVEKNRMNHLNLADF